MAGKRFPIGKILYILSNKKQRVVPAIVVEENHRKVRKPDGTLHEIMNYKVTFGPAEGQRVTIDLNRVDGEVYESLDEIQKLLRDRLEAFLSDLLSSTKKQVQEWYGVTPDNDIVQETDDLEGEGSKLDPEALLNGQVQSPEQVSTGTHPLQLQTENKTQLVQPPLRDHIKRMVSPDADTLGPLQDGQRFVILENGDRVPVEW
jgi:hypothetical protein